MSDLFVHAAARMVPVAAQILGWKPQDFWDATPEELALCLADPSSPSRQSSLSRTDLELLMEQDCNG